MSRELTIVWFDLERRQMIDEHGLAWTITQMIDSEGEGTEDVSEAVSLVGYLAGDGAWLAVHVGDWKPAGIN